MSSIFITNKNNIDENEKEIISDNYKNEICIKYKFDSSSEKLKIFGKKFVENNKDKCKIEYKHQSFLSEKEVCNLTETIYTDDFYGELIEITLKDIDKITDMSYLFDGCKSLLALPDISEWDTSKITNMCALFNGCVFLISISDISKWDTSNVTDMQFMFNGCNSLMLLL